RPAPASAGPRWAPATDPRRSAHTTFLRTASPIIAFITLCTTFPTCWTATSTTWSTPCGRRVRTSASVPEPAAHPSSIGAALNDAADRLAASGLPGSRREATMLWAAVQGGGTKPGDVWLRRDQEPAPDLVERFWRAVERRSNGVPFAYAVGRTNFRTLDLTLDPRALIPRPE